MSGAIGVDFDGVIHSYDKGWQGGQIYGDPMPGVKEGLEYLMTTFPVFIFTARPFTQHISIKSWLRSRLGLRILIDGDEAFPDRFWDRTDAILLTRLKYPALAYIDDRGLRFTTWTDVPGQLLELRIS